MSVPYSFRPIIIFFVAFGVFPYGKRHLFGLSATLIAIVLIFFFSGYRDHIDFSEYETVENFNDGVQFIVTFTSVLTIFLETNQRHKDFEKFFENLRSLTQIYHRMGIFQLNQYYNKAMWIYTRRFLFLLLVTIVLETLILFACSGDADLIDYWLVNILPLMLNRIRHLQYAFFLTIITVPMKISEDALSAILNQVNVLPTIDGFQEQLTERFRNLKKAHILLLTEIATFNHIFRYSLVVNLAQNFVELLSGTYWVYLQYENKVLMSGMA